MIIVRLLSTRAFLVGWHHQSLLGRRSRRCHGINYTSKLPKKTKRGRTLALTLVTAVKPEADNAEWVSEALNPGRQQGRETVSVARSYFVPWTSAKATSSLERSNAAIC